MSELELLYSRACGLPIYMKETKKLEGKISSTKVDVTRHNSLMRFLTL
jgi:histone demethylase JARID1